MLGISELSKKMPASPIRKLVPFADAAKKRGTKVYHLNIGQPDIDSPKPALDAISHQPFHVLAYTHSEGTSEYRESLAKYYQNREFDVQANDLLITRSGFSNNSYFTNCCTNANQKNCLFWKHA